MNSYFTLDGWLSWEFSVRWTLTLAHFLWQGCAVGLAAWGADWALRRASANSRYLVNVTALFLMLASVPATYALLTPRTVDVSHAAIDVTPKAQPTPEVIEPVQPAPMAVEMRPAAVASTEQALPVSTRITFAAQAVSPVATLAYLLGVLLMLARLSAALWGTARLRREALPVADASLLEMLARQSARLGLSAVPAVAWCGRVSTPVVVGLVRPMILLPPAIAGGLSPAQLEAVLAHELAHLARLDLVVNLLQRLAEAILFFHPAVWYVSGRISHERENCCDDRVLAAGWGRIDYANALVCMAELAAPRGTALGAVSLAAAGERPSQFKRRVLRLLKAEDRLRLGISRGGILAAAGLLVVLAIALSFAGRWSVGEDREKNPTPGSIVSSKTNDELSLTWVSFRAAPWKDVLEWYAKEMNQSIAMEVAPGGSFTYESPRPLDQRETILLINSELQKRGYCLIEGEGTVMAVASSDVLARRHADQLQKDFMHGTELRKGPDKFDSYFEVVEHRAIGQMTGPGAPEGPATAYVLQARRDFTAAELSKFLAACFAEISVPSLHSGQPVMVDGFAVLHKGKWLGVKAPALLKGERIEVWQNYAQEWNARAPADYRIAIEGLVLDADGKPRADARVHRLMVEGPSGAVGENPEIAKFLNWAYGGAAVVDKKGRFQISLRHQTQFVRKVWLYAVAPGCAPQRIGPIDVGYDLASKPLTIKLQRGFAGQIKLVRPDGKPLDKGEVAVAAQDDVWGPGIPMATYPLDGKPVRVADCPVGPLMLKVRVPGIPELEIRDVQAKADEVIEIKRPLAEEQPQKPAADPKKANVEMLLETRVALAVADKPLIFVLDELEKAHGVGVTLDLKALRAKGVDPHTRISIEVKNMKLREVFRRVLAAAELNFDVTAEGIHVPAKAVARLEVKYDFPGAEAEGQISVEHEGQPIGTKKWGSIKTTPVKQRETLTLNDFPAGNYEVGRYRQLVFGGFGSSRVLDRQLFPLKAGQTKTIDFSRPGGQRISGKVLDVKKLGVEHPVLNVCSPGAKDVTSMFGPDSTFFDVLLCEADGSFTTDPLVPGKYTFVVQGYRALTPIEKASTGTIEPTHIGVANVTVAAEGKQPAVEIKLVDAAKKKDAPPEPDASIKKALERPGVTLREDTQGRIVEVYLGEPATDEILKQLISLPKLKMVWIESARQLTPAGFAHLAAIMPLESLNIYSTGLRKEALAEIAKIPNLRRLSLGECGIGDAELAALAGLSKLQALELRGNRITDAGMVHVARLENLEELDLGNSSSAESTTSISDDGLADFTSLRKLKRLDLSSTRTQLDVSSRGLAHLASFPDLESLRLSGPRCTDKAMEHVGRCKNLRHLELGFTAVGDAGFAQIRELKKLERVSISSSRLTEEGLVHLGALANLKHAELRTDAHTDRVMKALAQLMSLERLDIYGSSVPGVAEHACPFTAAGLASFKGHPTLRTLYLTNLAINGELLDALKQLKTLGEISMMMPSLSADEVRALQKALPDVRISAAWGGSGIAPLQLEDDLKRLAK